MIMTDSAKTDETPEVQKQSTWGRWLKRVGLGLACFIVFLLIVVGPWPADNSSYSDTDYEKSTLARMDSLTPLGDWNAPLQAGVSRADITPEVGHPLAGYGNRRPLNSDSLQSRCYVKALTLASPHSKITIVSADILLVMGELRQLILKETKLRPEEIFFTATHNHSGPGGYVDGIVQQFIMGDFDQAYRDRLVKAFAKAIFESRANVVPVEVASFRVRATGKVKNRLNESLPAYDLVTGLVCRRTGKDKPFAVLVSFAAHPTVFRSKHHMISSEYPGVLCNHLAELTGAEEVLFAASSVGDSRPKLYKHQDYVKRVQIYGEDLAKIMSAPVKQAKFTSRTDLLALNLKVDMPGMRVPIGEHFRLSPIAASIVSSENSYISLLRVGDVVMVGMPGDYAGVLTSELEKQVEKDGLKVMLTSFNGDYKGYFVRRSDFSDYGKYETRSMNFFGPWGGEYLNSIAAKTIAAKLTEQP